MIVCVEDKLYEQYLAEECSAAGMACVSVSREELVEVIADKPAQVLLLQSNSAEEDLLSVSARLKRLFADELCVLFLSADYRTREEAGQSFYKGS